MDMPSFYGALVQALQAAHQKGWSKLEAAIHWTPPMEAFRGWYKAHIDEIAK
jgi:hypothetical protein